MSNKNFLVKNGITVGSFNLVNENGNITANSITFLDGSTQSSGQNITSNSINTSSINTSSISANSIVTNFITFSDGSRQSSIPKTLVGNENFSTATYYPLLTLTAAGSITSANTSSLGLSYVPSTGTLTATILSSTSLATGTLTATILSSTSLGIGTAASGVIGEIRAANNITAYYSSDARLKENVVNISNPISKVKALNGVEFDWTDKYLEEHGGEDGYFLRKHDIGIIAQELEKVLPEIVADRPDGYKAVKYDRIVALLIEAIKEQQKQIDALTQKVK